MASSRLGVSEKCSLSRKSWQLFDQEGGHRVQNAGEAGKEGAAEKVGTRDLFLFSFALKIKMILNWTCGWGRLLCAGRRTGGPLWKGPTSSSGAERSGAWGCAGRAGPKPSGRCWCHVLCAASNRRVLVANPKLGL